MLPYQRTLMISAYIARIKTISQRFIHFPGAIIPLTKAPRSALGITMEGAHADGSSQGQFLVLPL